MKQFQGIFNDFSPKFKAYSGLTDSNKLTDKRNKGPVKVNKHPRTMQGLEEQCND